MTILPLVTLPINRMSFFTFTFYFHKLFTHIFSAYILHLHLCSSFSSYTFSHFISFYHQPTQKWPDHMKQTQLQRNLPHPRNTSRNLGNLGMNILGNLGIVMNNVMNTMKFLGKPRGRINMSRISLELLIEWQNSQRFLGMSKRRKPRGRERRRRFNSLKNLLPRGKGLKRMTLLFTEMGHWSQLPPSLRRPFQSSTMACSSI